MSLYLVFICSTNSKLRDELGKMKRLLIFSLFFLFLIPTHSQSIKFSQAVRLSDEVNTDAEEISPFITNDGKTLFFVRAFHPSNVGGANAGTDIWMSTKDSLGHWSQPTNKIGKWNNSDNNAVVGIREDDQVVYLLNSYKKESGIAFSKFVDGKWTSPDVIEIPGIAKKNFIGFHMSKSFDVLFISMEGNDGYGQEDIYVSLADSVGKWSRPANLGPTINTNGFEIAPFLSDDKNTLFFSSNGHGGSGGSDLFVSQRLYDSWSVWSKPRNLGSSINSFGFDAYYNQKDSVVYLASAKNGRAADIFEAKIDLNSLDSAQLRINELMAEAKSLLVGLSNAEGNDDLSYMFLTFQVSESELTKSARTKLNDLVKEIKAQGKSEIIMISSTNDMATESLNQNLSYTRMEAIRDYVLSRLGQSKIDFKLHVNNSVISDYINGVELQYRE